MKVNLEKSGGLEYHIYSYFKPLKPSHNLSAYLQLLNMYINKKDHYKEEIILPLRLTFIKRDEDGDYYKGIYFYKNLKNGVRYLGIVVKSKSEEFINMPMTIYDFDLFCKYYKLDDDAKASVQTYIDLNNGTVNFEKLLKIVDSLK